MLQVVANDSESRWHLWLASRETSRILQVQKSRFNFPRQLESEHALKRVESQNYAECNHAARWSFHSKLWQSQPNQVHITTATHLLPRAQRFQLRTAENSVRKVSLRCRWEKRKFAKGSLIGRGWVSETFTESFWFKLKRHLYWRLLGSAGRPYAWVDDGHDHVRRQPY